jgi:RAB protein geranylgeranyltransferase component A
MLRRSELDSLPDLTAGRAEAHRRRDRRFCVALVPAVLLASTGLIGLVLYWS